MNSRFGRFLGVVLLQCVLLLGVIGFKQYTVWAGTTVTLKVVPLDPRSPFSGDYVHLAYEISSLNRAKFDPSESFYTGEPIYVEIAKTRGIYWHAVAAHHSAVSVPNGHVLLRGTVDDESGSILRVHYGIEDVYVPEGKGQIIERHASGVAVEVKVDRFQNAVVQGVLINGKPYDAKQR